MLRSLSNREIVFSRAVLLVEDDSQREFLLGTLGVLGVDLDAAGVSIVSVDGENGFAPFVTVLTRLRIPFVCLKDKAWGNEHRFPSTRYFSLGMELETFLDRNELADQRQAVKGQVGTSKPRVAGSLAQQITREQVPKIFQTLLREVIELANGSPTHDDGYAVPEAGASGP